MRTINFTTKSQGTERGFTTSSEERSEHLRSFRPNDDGGKAEATALTPRAFTIVELLIVIGIFAAIAAFSVGIGNSAILRANAAAERDTLVSLLSRARNLSMSNVNEVDHGVHHDTVVDAFVLFEDEDDDGTYDSGEPSQSVPGATTVNVSGFANVTFDQLSGRTSAVAINVTDGAASYTIDVNAEGRIDW